MHCNGGELRPVRDSVFHWISTFLNEPITTNGDYRSFIGAGPYNLGNGESVKVGFVVVAGTNLGFASKYGCCPN